MKNIYSKLTSVRGKTLGSFAIIILLVLGMIAVSIYQLRQIQSASMAVVPGTEQVEYVQEFTEATSSLEVNLDRLFVTGDVEAQENIRQELNFLQGTLSTLQAQPIAGTEDSIEQLAVATDQLETTLVSFLDADQASWSSNELNRALINLYGLFDNVHTLEQQLLDETLANLRGTADVQQSIISNVNTQFLVLGTAIFLIALFAVFVLTRTLRPIGTLTKASEEIADGNFDREVPVESNDEIGTLAQAFNNMTGHIRDLIDNLEQRVTERTNDLDLAAEIGRSVSQIRDLDELAATAVSQIQQRFDLYHVQLYLADKEQNKLTLFASTGEAGKQMLATGHTLSINSNSLNGRTAVEKQAILVSDTATSPNFKPHPLLPNTRSETAVPLLVGNNVVGVLDLQSSQPHAFTEESLPAFTTLAGQLAIAIENSILFTEQTRSEERLIDEQERTRAILESISTPVAIARVSDGVLVYVNEPSAQLTGIPREEIEGRPTPNFFQNPEDRQVYVNKLRQEGAVNNYEVMLKKGDGIPYWALMTGRIAQFQGESVTITTYVDITERKAIEAEFIKFKLGMERSADAVFLTDVDGTITYVNDAFVDIYGYTKEEAIGQTPRIIKSGMIPQESYEYFWQTLLSGGIVAGEIVNKTKDGRLVNIEGNNNPIQDETGQVIGFLAMHRDITERKHIEETNQEREALLRTIIDSTPDWIFITDTNHRYQMVNQAYAASLNRSPKEFIGKNALEMGVPEDIVKGNPEKDIIGFWPIDEEAMASGEVHILDEEPSIVAGKPRILTTTRVPLKDATGNVTGLVGYINDITDIKEAEIIMAKQAEDLQTVAELSTAVSTQMDTEQLLIDIVNRTKESFGLYHVHIYLIDEAEKTLKLTAGAGDAGTAMIAAGYQIPIVHENSLVAKVARTKQGVIVNNVMADPGFLPNPLLFDTKSEIAVPMMIGNRVIGVLDAQADKINHFSETDINIQTTLATQIAVTLENTRAFQQANEQASIIQATPNIIATSSLDGRIRFMNEAGLRRLGYESLSEIIGQPVTIFYPPDSNLEHRQQAMETVKKHGIWQGENRLTTKSGEIFPVDQIITLIRDEQGHPQMTAVNMTDITAREEAEASQQALNAELEAQLERVNALQRAMTRESWQAFMTTTASKRVIQGFEFNQDGGVKTLTKEDLVNGKNGKSKTASVADKEMVEVVNPVTVQGTTIGKIGVRNPNGDPLSEEQKLLLASLTNQVGEALDRARLFEETELGRQEIEAQAADLETINEISDLASAYLNMDDLLTAVGDQILETFNANSTFIALIDENTETITFPYFRLKDGSTQSPSPRQATEEEGGFTGQIYRSRQPMVKYYEENSTLETIESDGGQLVGEGRLPDSVIGVPMIVGNRIIGVLGLNGHKEFRQYDESDIPLLSTLASTLAVSIQNALQYEETQRRARELAVLNETAELVASELNIEKLLESVYQQLKSVMEMDVFMGQVWHPETQETSYPLIYDKGQRFTQERRPVDPSSDTYKNLHAGKTWMLIPTEEEKEARKAQNETVGIDEIPNMSVFVPMYVGTKPVGTLSIQNYSGTFTDDEITLLEGISNHVALGIENSNLFAQTELRASELATMNEISELSSSKLNLDDLVNTVGDQLLDTFSANSVYIALVDDKTEAISFPYFYNRQDGYIRNIPQRTVNDKGGFTGEIYKTRQPIVQNFIDGFSADDIKEKGGQTIGDGENTDSYIGVPMIVGDQVIGVIGLNGKQELRTYEESDVPLLSTLARTIGVSLQNVLQFEATQRRANREAMVNEISQKIQGAPTIESAMQTAVAELGKALGIQRAIVELKTDKA